MSQPSSNQALSDYLTVGEAAKYLGISTWTLRNWDRSGKLRARRHPVNGHRLYFHEDLDAMLRSIRVSGATEPPHWNWASVCESDHIVQFYENDEFLAASVSKYLLTGLERDEGAIVIAAKSHREAIERHLASSGIDCFQTAPTRQLVMLDAAETLAQFMVDGVPDPERFRSVIGGIVAQTVSRHGRVRAFGEMVALLWANGNQSAAIQVEALWSELGKTHSFALLCAYPMNGFGDSMGEASFSNVCSLHSRVVPADGYVKLVTTDDRHREIARLQQMAQALEAEIAHRKEVERNLAQRERDLSDFLESSFEGVHRLAPDGTILWANRAELAILGYESDEYVGRNIAAFHVDRDVIDDMLARLARGDAIHDCPARMRAQDGSIRDVRVNANACFEDGRFLYSRGFTRDVSERLRAEQGRLALEERFSRFMHHLPGLAWIKDLQGRYAYVNDAAEKAFVALRSKLIGATDADLFPAATAEQFQANDRAALESPAGVLVVETLTHEDGTLHHSLVSKFSIPDLDGKPAWIGGMAIDITERIDAENALREAARRKDEFIATLAHELRNPLAPIRNALEIMRIQNADGGQLHEMMQRQVKHLMRLVDDLLEVSRITRGKIELRRERVSIAVIVESALDVSLPLIESFEHRLTVEFPPEPLIVDVDPVRLAQVIANLLNNAAKYTDPKGEIRLSVSREDSWAVIRVRDTGIGIPPELIPRLFEMFTQLNRTSERAQGGLGIGLSVVQSLVKMHGGTVEAHSEGVQKGSTFTIRLPLAIDSPRSIPAGVAPDPSPNAKKPGLRLLVVDDNRDAAESLAILLRATGNEVDIAFDGPSALVMMCRKHPDAVFLDLGLPIMDGYEVARRIRAQKQFSDLVIVALSGWGNEKDRRRSRAAGIDHHLIKPAEFEEIQALLMSASTRRRVARD